MPRAGGIRPCRPADWPAVAALLAASDPEHPVSVAEIAHAEALVDPRVHRRRYVYVEDNRVLGHAGFLQFSLMFDPSRFVLYLEVAPDARRRGIGGRLLEHLGAELAPRKPRQLGLGVWESQPAALRFLAGQGYRRIMREIESRTELAGIPAEVHRACADRLRATGLSFERLDRLGDGRDWREQIFALDMAVSEDIPMTGELTRPDFAVYAHLHFADPRFRPELCWLAMDRREPVGLTWHVPGVRPGELENVVSGVRRSHRRRGIATALKGLALADARELGHRFARTRNEENNVGMLAVNRRLGYRPCGAFAILEKELKA